jgi:hypothetical protein
MNCVIETERVRGCFELVCDLKIARQAKSMQSQTLNRCFRAGVRFENRTPGEISANTNIEPEFKQRQVKTLFLMQTLLWGHGNTNVQNWCAIFKSHTRLALTTTEHAKPKTRLVCDLKIAHQSKTKKERLEEALTQCQSLQAPSAGFCHRPACSAT